MHYGISCHKLSQWGTNIAWRQSANFCQLALQSAIWLRHLMLLFKLLLCLYYYNSGLYHIKGHVSDRSRKKLLIIKINIKISFQNLQIGSSVNMTFAFWKACALHARFKVSLVKASWQWWVMYKQADNILKRALPAWTRKSLLVCMQEEAWGLFWGSW